MKTAISISDSIFDKAEAVAKRMGVSRSRLYTLAVEEFLKTHSDEQVTDRLNELYSGEDSTVPTDLARAQRLVMEDGDGYETW